MRLPNSIFARIASLGLTATLAGCGISAGDGKVATIDGNIAATSAGDTYGPAGDYPMVLGEPYTIDGIEYSPADVLNYDEVGYAMLDVDGGQGVTAAHRTLPLPSYIEVTSLDTGKTILVRVERRGPMTGSSLVALSRDAQLQLGSDESLPVRVRRVNPPEIQRAELRRGNRAPERIETPQALLKVLRRQLPSAGSAPLRRASDGSTSMQLSTKQKSDTGPTGASTRPEQTSSTASPSARSFENAFATLRRSVTTYPLRPIAAAVVPVQAPAATQSASVRIKPTHVSPPSVVAGDNRFVIQAAAFSSQTNAKRAAEQVGGVVTSSGRFYRVRTGPYSSRGQAEAALAKVRAAGYSDARVFTTG